jgi:hypothetical protein
MKQLQFTETKEAEYYSYSFINRSGDRLFQPDWHWFGDNWDAAYKQIVKGRFFNVLPFTGFDIVIFPLLAWELTNGLQRVAGNWGETKQAERYLGRKPDYPVSWIYTFGTSISSSNHPVGSELFEKRDDALYCLNAIDDIFSLQIPRIGDHTIEITLYGIHSYNKEPLIDILSYSTVPPMFSAILELADIFVTFIHSCSLNYLDGITIKSKNSLSEEIEKASSDLMSRFADFNKALQSCDTVPEYLKLLATLVDDENKEPA